VRGAAMSLAHVCAQIQRNKKECRIGNFRITRKRAAQQEREIRTIQTPSFTPVAELRTLRTASAFQHHAHLAVAVLIVFFATAEANATIRNTGSNGIKFSKFQNENKKKFTSDCKSYCFVRNVVGSANVFEGFLPSHSCQR
jgi:hypothetical protein